MKPKTLLVPSSSMVGAVPVDVTLSGSLTTEIRLEAAPSVSVALSGALTTGIQLVAAINVNVGLFGPLFTAKVGRALSQCGHPMFTKCERQHLGEES